MNLLNFKSLLFKSDQLEKPIEFIKSKYFKNQIFKSNLVLKQSSNQKFIRSNYQIVNLFYTNCIVSFKNASILDSFFPNTKTNL
ncbi:hypothetical protein LEP1GSC041_4208 [Leptospira noguchii str. 2006001870]|nr:hypothetical protein LEP1GSC041_4208 [Leptospira noguchii str. 2006001870]